MDFRHPRLLLALSAASFASPAWSQTVAWGTSVSFEPLGYYSDGTATGSSLTWTLGYFVNGFVPDQTNFAEWANHYVEVDRDFELLYEPFYAVSGIKSDVGATAAGRQAWIFAYNDLAQIGTPDGEALLFAEVGFLFPQIPLSGTFDIEDNPNNSIDDVFNVVWGQVDRDRDSDGGLVAGGGSYSSRLADTDIGAWEAQTATWPGTPTSPFELAVLSITDPEQRGADDDPDHDGRSNLWEHAAATPLGTTDGGYPMIELGDPGSLRVILPAARPADVRYRIEFSTTLSGIWSVIAECVGTGPWQGASPTSITPAPDAREWIDFSPPTGDRGFFRLRFELVAP